MSSDTMTQTARDLNGLPITLADLPPVSTERWVLSRKAKVVSLVQAGLISREAVLERYSMTEDEFIAWTKAVQEHH